MPKVKDYIAKNQHLPELPFAGEAIRNGLDLGETNRLLFKKVEAPTEAGKEDP